MCVQVTPKIEFLFQGIDDPFLQDLEEIYTEEPDGYNQGKSDIQKVLDFIMLYIPYIFIIQRIFIYINVNLDALILILYTLIYGMIITINQLHKKNTRQYWLFILFISFVLPYDQLITLYVIPFTIEYIFNKNNHILTMLVEHYNIILGNHMFWTFIISCIWFVVYY